MEAENIVVGVGASAGGLEAIQEFFDNMPPDTGLSFVVIQHLSPDFKSMMNELLSRNTSMAIHVAQHGMEIAPNSVYLIPPKKEYDHREELPATGGARSRSPPQPADQLVFFLAGQRPR